MIAPTSPVNAPMFSIVVLEKGGAERREAFATTELSVGRVQGNDLMLPKGNVSKRHARLLYRDGRFIVADLNSTNGTYVNRRKITQATIVREGDRIYIGDFVLRIELGRDEGADEPRTSQSVLRSALAQAPESSTPQAAGAPTEAELEELRGPGPSNTPSSVIEATPASSQTPIRAEPGLFESHPGRPTELDRSEGERAAFRALVRALVDGVAVALKDTDLSAPVVPSLGERIEGLLQSAWNELAAKPETPAHIAADRVIEAARCELVEHGPITELLSDPQVSEIGVARFDKIVALRGGRASAVEPAFSSDRALRWAVARLCAEAQAPLVPGESVIERRLGPGVQMSAVLGPLAATGAYVAIRKARRPTATLEELVRRGAISRGMASFFQQCLTARVNLLILGPRSGGVEVLLAALAQASGDGPVVFIGEGDSGGTEANLVVTGAESKDTSAAISVAALLPGSRLVAELVTGEVTAKIVESIADGTDGVIAARYAPNLRRGLLRMPAVMAAERPQIRIAAARELVASAFEVVVEVARLRDGRHRVLRVSEVVGVANDDIHLREIFTFNMHRTAAGGAIEGTFHASGIVPDVVEAMRARGVGVESTIFSRPPSR